MQMVTEIKYLYGGFGQLTGFILWGMTARRLEVEL
jgi:hypothetical protein